ncbi:hypothetical protein LIER_11965 [Lithospermum erythrorhizon]|uniref:Uncharacterized protein n=1 Tax=Lithospermum erythrorhizon TaxID=34254 RepID=A0AAV3PSC0_LITER
MDVWAQEWERVMMYSGILTLGNKRKRISRNIQSEESTTKNHKLNDGNGNRMGLQETIRLLENSNVDQYKKGNAIIHTSLENQGFAGQIDSNQDQENGLENATRMGIASQLSNPEKYKRNEVVRVLFSEEPLVKKHKLND